MFVSVKLKKRHPYGKMQMGKYTITNQPQVIDIDDRDLWELKSEGGKTWFQVDLIKEKKDEKIKKKKEK